MQADEAMAGLSGSAAARALSVLIERLEASEGPNFARDYELHHVRCGGIEGVGMYGDHPAYTASLDAALSLMTEDQWWLFAKGRAQPDEPLYAFQIYRREDRGSDHTPIAEAEPENRELCVVITALQAKLALARAAAKGGVSGKGEG